MGAGENLRFETSYFGMRALGLLQEPRQPRAVPTFSLLELGKAVGEVALGIACKLCSLNELEDDGLLESDEHRTDIVEREDLFCGGRVDVERVHVAVAAHRHDQGEGCGCGRGEKGGERVVLRGKVELGGVAESRKCACVCVCVAVVPMRVAPKRDGVCGKIWRDRERERESPVAIQD